LEQAITCYESAIEVFGSKADPQGWARLQNNLAISYAQRLIGNPIENVEQCIAHLKVALKAASKKVYPREWAMTQHNLGNAHTLLRGRGRENLKNAIACFKRALEVRTLDQFPVDYQQTQAALGSVYFGKRQWSPAVAAYREAMRAERALLAAAFTETGQLAEMAETKELYARTAYALLKLRRPGDALAQLEQGKARLLSRALALNDVDLSFLPTNEQETIRSLRRTIRALEAEMRLPPDTRGRRDDLTLAETLDKSRAQLEEAIKGIRQTHPDFIPEVLDVAEILALIPHDGVLMAPVITSHGSAVFVVPTGMQSVAADQVLWLEHFKELDLQALLMGSDAETRQSGWLWSYANARSDAKRWLDTIETTGQVLWDRFLAQVTERLVSLGAKHILLMPQGGLGLLPVHAAWRDIDQTRRYFIDDYSVSYVPSAYARSVSHTRLRDARRRTRTLLAVVNPTEDLQFTPIEGEQIASLFGQENSTVLPGSKATSEAVVQGLANYIHFACHGFYRWGDPMQSGLVLAKKKPLTLAQIKGRLSLEKTRLVTLSACETGITDIRQLPDEYLGLPVGFLQVGAPAVVSSLWAVNDLSTMLLMERFYQLHLHDAKDLPDALCGAQCWLRDVTAAELAKRFADEEEAALVGKGRMPLELASEYFLRFAQQNPVHQPFGHPYHWAAFTFSGA
jgi:CHAT domain-containing protein/tetratricopeptide (TPR) repeat protein